MKKLIIPLILILFLPGCVETDRRVLTSINYGDDVCKLSRKHDVSYSYLMSIITLECSGRKPCGSRYEDHVFKRLKKVRSGQRRRMDRNVTHASIANASDAALVNLATSWGPFQLMGYHSIGLKTTVSQIRGADSLNHGVAWIKEDYGHILSKGQFRDAFHWHNAGKRYPKSGKTKSRSYVRRGLSAMEYFAGQCHSR